MNRKPDRTAFTTQRFDTPVKCLHVGCPGAALLCQISHKNLETLVRGCNSIKLCIRLNITIVAGVISNVVSNEATFLVLTHVLM